MIGRKLQFVLASFSLCLALAETPAKCHACSWCNRSAAPPVTTTYRPFFGVAAPPVVAQSVNYVPYTAYRTVYTNMPVTTYQPMTACGPCGTPTTVLRPVTTMALRPQLVPYTTYRPVVSAVAACAPCGGVVPVTVPLVPSQMTGSMVPTYGPAPGCANCAAPPATVVPAMPGSPVQSLAPTPNINAPPTLNYAPAQPYSPSSAPFSPPPANYSSPAGGSNSSTSATQSGQAIPPGFKPSTQLGPLMPLNGSNAPGSPGSGPPSTFKNDVQGASPESRSRLKVIPDTDPNAPNGNTPGGSGPDVNNPGNNGDTTPNSNDGGIDGRKTNLRQPRLLDPHDRMTALPLSQLLVYKPVSASPVTRATAIEQVPLDDNGWRPSRRAE